MPHNSYLNWPSVTTIIQALIPNPGIESWKKKIGKTKAEIISKTAREYGSNLHKVVEQAAKTGEWPQEIKGLKHAKKFVEKFGKDAVYEQHRVASILAPHNVYGYHGTPDFVKGSIVADWKTSKFFDSTYIFQLIGYSHLVVAKTGYLIPIGEKALALKPYRYTGLNKYWPVWEELVRLWWAKFPGGIQSEKVQEIYSAKK